MKPNLIHIAVVLTLLTAGRAFAQEQKAAASADKPKDVPAQAGEGNLKPSLEELEAKFKATLTKAVMKGRWASVKDGVLGPEKEDKYTIVGVNKVGGDAWIISARVQYGKRDFVAPLPVQVKWAGDTAVIVVDKLTMPGGGTYSARVLVYGNTYAGTWTGGDHGGLLNGVITGDTDGKPAGEK